MEAGRSPRYPACSDVHLDPSLTFNAIIEQRLQRTDCTIESNVVEHLAASERPPVHWWRTSICLWRSGLVLLIGRCAGMMAEFWYGGPDARVIGIGACSIDVCCSQ